MSGMFTSNRITAKSLCKRCCSASSPEFATTSVWPSCSSAFCTAIVVRSSSSTMSTLAFGALGWRDGSGKSSDGTVCAMVLRSELAGCGTEGYDIGRRYAIHRAGLFRALKPDPKHRDQLLDVDGLRDVVRRTSLDAFLAVPLHRLGCNRKDRQVGEGRHGADFLDRLIAVHARHHDVDQYRIGIGQALEDFQSRPAAFRIVQLDVMLLKS